jgi:hypothetical protein
MTASNTVNSFLARVTQQELHIFKVTSITEKTGTYASFLFIVLGTVL